MPVSGDARRRAEGLSVVEIEIGSRCNRRCPYCPVSIDPTPPVPVRMSEEVFLTTVEQLADIGFDGRLSYHLYNEPLLRKDLPRLVALAADHVPDALQLLNTNGDLLDDRRYHELREAGMDWFFVTRHSPGAFGDRDFQVVQHWVDLRLTNRGGTVTHVPPPPPDARRTPCYAPSEMLIVSVTGDVLLCYEDARREHVLGNVCETHLADIWDSERFNAYRRRLERGDRSVDDMCLACSNVAHAEPGRSALEDPVLAATGLTRGPEAVPTLKRRSVEARARQRARPA